VNCKDVEGAGEEEDGGEDDGGEVAEGVEGALEEEFLGGAAGGVDGA